MSALLTFVDIQTQTQKQTVSDSKHKTSSTKPGFFDSLVNEYKTAKNFEPENTQPAFNEANPVNIQNGKIFTGSALEILANVETQETFSNVIDDAPNLLNELKISLGKIQDSMPEVLYDDDEVILNEEISKILSMTDEELNEILEALPEELRTEVKNLIDEINKTLENGSDITALKSSVETISNSVRRRSDEFKPQIKTENLNFIGDDDNDNDETQMSELNSANLAGAAAVQNNENKITDSSSKAEPENNFALDDSLPGKNLKHVAQNQQNSKNEIQTDDTEKVQTETETKSPSQSEHVEHQDKENQNLNGENYASENESENQNQNPNFSQSRENFSDNRNQSRARNDNRRISNENLSNDEHSTSAHRTESRNDFQSFFDGILNTRRASSTSTAQSQPLSLRENLNLNQSETLRNGLTNVVRFIREDGVRKANIVIDPPALGRISVELTSNSSGVEASIKVASEQIRQLVQDQLTQLRMNLSEQGVQVAEFTVDVQQDSQQGGSQNGNENQRDSRDNFVPGLEEDDEEEFRIDLEEGLLYWVA